MDSQQPASTVFASAVVTEGPASTAAVSKPLSKEGKGRFRQERIMFGFLLLFVFGVLGLTYIPEPYNGPVTGVVSLGAIWLMFGF